MSVQIREGQEVLKFGGTSVTRLDQVAEVIALHADNCPVVVSAPGRRFDGDVKVTDLLIDYAEHHDPAVASTIEARFEELASDHMQPKCVASLIDELRQELRRASVPHITSRGEYFAARILAAKIGGLVFDAADLITFASRSTLDRDATRENLQRVLGRYGGQPVIPGFYGADKHGWTRIFRRGGSDRTGAIVSEALHLP